jgi:hypothetical protein
MRERMKKGHSKNNMFSKWRRYEKWEGDGE